MERECFFPVGISAPTVVPNRWVSGGSPEVVHETGTGRLRWSIGASGNVVLEVFRPGGVFVACVTVMCNNEEKFQIEEIWIHPEGEENLDYSQLFERHVAAVSKAVTALALAGGLTETEVDAALQPLWDRALPDPLVHPDPQSRWTIGSPLPRGDDLWFGDQEPPITYYWRANAAPRWTIVHGDRTAIAESETTAAKTVQRLRQMPQLEPWQALHAVLRDE